MFFSTTVDFIWAVLGFETREGVKHFGGFVQCVVNLRYRLYEFRLVDALIGADLHRNATVTTGEGIDYVERCLRRRPVKAIQA